VSNSTRDVFKEVIIEVLEKFAFLFADADEQRESPGAVNEFFHVIMSFSGPAHGIVSLTAPEGLCRELAANVLGIESAAVTAAALEDAMKELVNIICGNLTVALFGDQVICFLTIPAIYRVDRTKWHELAADPSAVHLGVDDTPLLANLVVVGGREE